MKIASLMSPNCKSHFQVDDIALDKHERWFRFSMFGDRVQAVSPDRTLVRINGEWVASDTFRWIGSIGLYQQRIAFQKQFISILMDRKFYSLERKREVVDSAILILNRFLFYIKHQQVSAQDSIIKNGSKVGGFFESDQDFHQGICISEVAKRPDGIEVITVDWGDGHLGTERIDMLTLLA